MSDFAGRIGRLPQDTVASLSFFSRLPVRPPAGSFDLHRSAAAWPLAGVLLAIGPALLFVLMRAAEFPTLVAALLALAALAVLTGAMHEDGLADAADGLGAAGTREERLDVMRDSRLGAYGGLALIFAIALKAAALASLGYSPFYGFLALLMAAGLSRTLAIWHWNATLPARADGMAWAAGRPDSLALAVALGIGAVAALVLLVAFGLSALLGIVMAIAGVVFFSSHCRRTIGGHTGDTIGAAQQIAETLILAGLSAGWVTTL
jgi:adenosylcobinamide-GDP ribazoletransferase